MKRILLSTTALVLVAIASVSGAAQTRPATTPSNPTAPQPKPGPKTTVPDTRIAIVDASMFGNDKAGITRYLNAVKTVQREFQPKETELNNIQGRIKAIADEIAKLSGNSVVGPQTIQTKQEESERLQRDWKYKKEQADADFEKRLKEVVGPITTDIGKALDQFASQNGLTMILDISKLLPAVLAVNPAMDLTQAFIAEYNRNNP